MEVPIPTDPNPLTTRDGDAKSAVVRPEFTVDNPM